MTDLPYTYTDDDGARLVVSRSTGRIEITEVDDVDSDVAQAHAIVSAPTGQDLVDFVGAALATAGDTGHMVISRDELTAMRRADARSMRERAVAAIRPRWDLQPDAQAEAREAIRALPLLPDTTEVQDAQLPDRGGDVIDDIRVALAQRHGLSDEHRAFYFEIVNRFEGLAADRDGVRLTRDRYRDERNIARAELADARRWGRILEAQRKDLRKKLSAETDRMAALRIAYQAAKDADLPEEDMVEPDDEVSDRVGALEQQYTDLANLVHGHGEDLARLRRRFTEEDDG